MGGAAARVPGAMIDKAVDMAGDRMDLVKAKLYIENYAMGNENSIADCFPQRLTCFQKLFMVLCQ